MPKLTNIIVKNDAKREAKGYASWRVNIPADFSETGKRRNIYFHTRDEAIGYANRLKSRRRAFGSAVANVTATMAAEWEECIKMLQPLNIGLLEVVKSMAKMIELRGTSYGIRGVEDCFFSGLKKEKEDQKSLTWKEAVKELLLLREIIQKRRPRTIKQIRITAERVERECEEFSRKLLSEITADDCRRMINECFSTPKQRDDARRVLSGVFTNGMKREWCKENPMSRLDTLVIKEKEILALTPNQVRELFVSSPRDCIPALAIMTFAGIRPEETTRLSWEDVDFSEKVISVRDRSSKTGGTRHVSMCPALISWLESCDVKIGNIIPKGWERKWGMIRKRAGWSPKENPWSADALRHTYASYHAKKHKDFPLLQMEMGHRSAQLLRQRYTNLSGVTDASTEEFWNIFP